MRARRSALFVVISLVAVIVVGLGQATFAGADPQGPPPPDQRGQSVEHRPVCGPAPAGVARCHSVLVVRTNARRPKPTTTTAAPTTTIATTTTTAAPTTTTTAAPTTTTTAAPTTTTTAGATTTTAAPQTCTTAHAGYTPCDLQAAYKLPSTSAGNGQTVAIVDAFDAPNVEADLGVYRSAYGLSQCTTANGCFRKVNQSGGSTPPAADGGWAQEISLDVDMVSATCPNCHILLVEANSASITDLATAVRTAGALGANAISNSYGASESTMLSAPDDSAYNQPGRAVTVSSGDNGYGVEFPASSPHVTAVGGTALTKASNSRGWSETAWSGAGSGCSSFFAKPSWQHDPGCAMRMVADVSAVADPNTGVAVYDSYAYQGASGWLEFGGTSVASPIVASVYALAGNASSIDPSYPYSHTASLFDVLSGNNGTCLLKPSYFCNATTGYDGPTGLGTPNGAGAF